MQRYKLTIEYIGNAFHGFQAQMEVPTVQVELEKAFAKLVGHSNMSRVVGSSRTDTGVHAIENVCHVDLNRIRQWNDASSVHHPVILPPHSPKVVENAINSFLREANQPIVVRNVETVSDTFHARYDARGREYIYQILMPKDSISRGKNDLLPSTVFTQDKAWYIPHALDIHAMKKACEFFQGEHDFTSFRGIKCQSPSPIRTLELLDIIEIGQPTDVWCKSNLHLYHVKANAPSFLYHMVRNIVGALVAVGTMKLQPDDILKILNSKNRNIAPPMAPAGGLYLSKVKYN